MRKACVMWMQCPAKLELCIRNYIIIFALSAFMTISDGFSANFADLRNFLHFSDLWDFLHFSRFMEFSIKMAVYGNLSNSSAYF